MPKGMPTMMQMNTEKKTILALIIAPSHQSDRAMKTKNIKAV